MATVSSSRLFCSPRCGPIMPSQGAVAPVPLYRETPLTWLPADKATKLQPAASAEDVGQAEGQLQQWQLTKLQQQAARGRRNVKVKDLCSSLQLSRADVLRWLRSQDRAANLAAQTNSTSTGSHNVWGPPLLQQGPDTLPKAVLRATHSAGVNPEGHAQGDWSTKHSRRLGSQAKSTLDAILRCTERPSKSIVDEVCLMHKVSRQQVLAYLSQHRTRRDWPREI